MAKLLLVEDELEIQAILKDALESWGIEVLSAQNIHEAKKILEVEKVRGVLSDISMPGGTGLDLLTEIRAGGNDVPFVFLSAYDDKEYIKHALRLGAIDYLQKPFNLKELEAIILKVLEMGKRIEKIESEETIKKDDLVKNKKFINLLRVNNLKKTSDKVG